MSALALLLPPLAAGVLALLSHIPLGRQVLRRGIVFIDLAIAQVASLGVLLAQSLLHWWHYGNEPHHLHTHTQPEPAWLLALAAAGAALAGAALVAQLARAWPRRQEALIGLLYVGAASAAIVLVSADPHGAQRLAALLAGDVLWATWHDLLPLAVASAIFALALRWRPHLLTSDAGFYACFALLISLSLPLLGLYLVFATLIVPALAAPRRAWLIGALGYAAGLLLSWHLDWPSGPSVVLALLALSMLNATWRKREYPEINQN